MVLVACITAYGAITVSRAGAAAQSRKDQAAAVFASSMDTVKLLINEAIDGHVHSCSGLESMSQAMVNMAESVRSVCARVDKTNDRMDRLLEYLVPKHSAN